MKDALAQVNIEQFFCFKQKVLFIFISRFSLFAGLSQLTLQVEVNFPESIAYKLNLYRGYIAICHPDDQHLNMVCTIYFLSR